MYLTGVRNGRERKGKREGERERERERGGKGRGRERERERLAITLLPLWPCSLVIWRGQRWPQAWLKPAPSLSVE